MTISHALIQTPIGKISITQQHDKIVQTRYLLDKGDLQAPTTALLKEATNQLLAYLNNPQTTIKLPIELLGTELQQKIWQMLARIPLGKTRTYGELAQEIKTSPRVIGNACRSNPVPLIIPCHRIVAQTGLGGFAGKTSGGLLDIKKWLLKHESATYFKRAN